MILYNFQGTASEATLVCLLGARAKAIAAAKVQFPDMEDAIIQSKLVAYTSDEVLCTTSPPTH